ncbi:3-deoxy-7-phosphoheptulonate synthase [Candidatus Peregrinibacteria bacterium CG_4_10_14_0_2_um_filter_38_24]|nr:MAG: 3-deoxy-7-phosphoheptulonate synthase [Candidatus Peregrinibacteria bacterium CG_4_10_14_0_2_um_filter_38_24]PJC38695.1 MAG: 3-deoxy-7-phosphoheptulonate synthase [Candidatus Peregrinibacteria bacterium CG_4_9_14_0_2_um_filter_38_9]
MIIVMKAGASKQSAEKIVKELKAKGLQPLLSFGIERTVINVIGEERSLSLEHLEALDGVEKVMRVVSPFKLVSKEVKSTPTVIKVNGVKIGDPKTFAVIAGPCSVESEEQMEAVAKPLAGMGVRLLRGGAFKPRTGPYAFQGLELEGLKIMKRIADKYKMGVVTEVTDIRFLDEICKYSDIVQVGARNMQNFQLLKELGKIKKPVLLKRGLSATIEELLLAAEYILVYGNENVILCERGIRTFEKETRNTLTLATVPLVKELSHLPIIVDPSHGTGKKSLIEPMTKASIACGADGVIIEVHANPKEALSDAQQQLTPEEFKKLLKNSEPIIKAVGKTMQ